MLAVQGCAMMLPPAATLATQALLALLMSSNNAYCSTEVGAGLGLLWGLRLGPPPAAFCAARQGA